MISHFDREQLIWGSSLSTNETILLLALNSFVDANGECWPGQELLARRCKFSDRTVRTVCKKLENKGVIVRNHRRGKTGQRTSDKFKVLFSAIPNQPENCDQTNRKELPLRQNQPENPAKPTGKLRPNQPEGASRDLSSKNYPEELSLEGQPEGASGRGRECDDSLQPVHPATQSEEGNSPVNPNPENSELMGSAPLESGQVKSIDQAQEIKSCGGAGLEKIKILLNRLSSDHVPGTMRQEWRMSGALPWRDPKTGDVPSDFASFVGKSLMFKGAQESMSALEKGSRHIRNAESTVAGMQGLIDSWELFSKRQVISIATTPVKSQEVPRTPMPDSVRRKWKSRIGRFARVG